MEHTRTINRRIETGAPAVLHVEARSGAVLVEAHAAAYVDVEAVVHVWSDMTSEADEAAALVAHGIEQDAHRAIVRAPSLPQTEGWSLWGGKRGSRVDYTIRVPEETAVRVLSRSGRVQLTGTRGRVHLELQSGRCSVERVQGDVAVISRSGGLTVERITGDVAVEARSGRMEIARIEGSVTADSRSGAVDIREISGEVTVTARTGSIALEQTRGSVRAQAHTGSIRYRGRVLADVELRAHTGVITMYVDPESPFFIDAESDTGSVSSDLAPRRGGGPPPEGAPKVRLRAHTGTIRISRM